MFVGVCVYRALVFISTIENLFVFFYQNSIHRLVRRLIECVSGSGLMVAATHHYSLISLRCWFLSSVVVVVFSPQFTSAHIRTHHLIEPFDPKIYWNMGRVPYGIRTARYGNWLIAKLACVYCIRNYSIKLMTNELDRSVCRELWIIYTVHITHTIDPMGCGSAIHCIFFYYYYFYYYLQMWRNVYLSSSRSPITKESFGRTKIPHNGRSFQCWCLFLRSTFAFESNQHRLNVCRIGFLRSWY